VVTVITLDALRMDVQFTWNQAEQDVLLEICLHNT